MPAILDAPPGRTAAPARTASDFTPLARQVRESGLLDRRIGYYVRAIGLNLGATAAVWAAVAWFGGAGGRCCWACRWRCCRGGRRSSGTTRGTGRSRPRRRPTGGSGCCWAT
ncbi:hypothetical protein ACFQHO_46030 [Actinomadura yumaensis]|uniref:hypothetical protein n=1 Tax=Actinomadura yumaensis TaxID=111807 RepID=UPI003615F292